MDSHRCLSQMFITNMLFLAVTAKSLILFPCGALGNGTYYLVAQPTVRCYQVILSSCLTVMFALAHAIDPYTP